MNRKGIIRKKLLLSFLFSKKTKEFDSHRNDKQKIIVALAADYGNLGDVAITYAQSKFLKEQFPNSDIIDFPISRTFMGMKSLKSIIRQHDIITIVGGGNSGDLYDDIEFCRQFIIKMFPKNKIISFPQTIDYSGNLGENKALKKAVKIYNKHSDLTLIAREQKSYEFYKRYFSTSNIFLKPDIVLTLNLTNTSIQRSGILTCLRNDKEKSTNRDRVDAIISDLKSYQILQTDTHIDCQHMSIEEREMQLRQIWNKFSSSELVITDRLHGMIFCAITNTPCLAIDNTNRKVSGVYNMWLKELGYIRIINEKDLDDIETHILEMVKCANKENVSKDVFLMFNQLF